MSQQTSQHCTTSLLLIIYILFILTIKYMYDLEYFPTEVLIFPEIWSQNKPEESDYLRNPPGGEGRCCYCLFVIVERILSGEYVMSRRETNPFLTTTLVVNFNGWTNFVLVPNNNTIRTPSTLTDVDTPCCENLTELL